ncbi:MAG: nicotinate (nicotinamide) nucleotide adenylyltransferase [Oscillospiraceae bacterium]
MRIGVYGGTFNPIHRGHLTAARAAADALGLEKVLLIPDSLPPHKELPAGSATGEDRLAMCRLTAGEVPGMEVLDLELRRSGPSYTSDTLAELHAQYPDDELWLLVGSDMFLSLQEWHEPERILSLAGIAAFHRTRGDETERFAQQKANLEQIYGARVALLENPDVVEISSTELRVQLAQGRGGAFSPRPFTATSCAAGSTVRTPTSSTSRPRSCARSR